MLVVYRTVGDADTMKTPMSMKRRSATRNGAGFSTTWGNLRYQRHPCNVSL